MGRRIHHHQPAPNLLLDAASDTLSRHEAEYPEEDAYEALARLHHELSHHFHRIATNGPFASSNGYLVYSVPEETWTDLCDRLEIYENARLWSGQTMLLAACRIADDDPHEPLADVQEAVTTEENRPVVVQAPWA